MSDTIGPRTEVIVGLDNIDIFCRDIRAMLEFYHERLGLPVCLPANEGETPLRIGLDAGNTIIFLVETDTEAGAVRRGIGLGNPAGIDSLGLAVRDLAEAVSTLQGCGIQFSEEQLVWSHPSGPRYDYRGFHDPEGNVLYIAERKGIHSGD